LATSLIKRGDAPLCICLYGDLGAGKTVLAQGFAKGLGLPDRLVSPTFLIVKQYNLIGGKKFNHMDLYRISGKKDLVGIGLDEMIQDSHAITLIEWAERLGEQMPHRRIDIHIRNMSEQERKITIAYVG